MVRGWGVAPLAGGTRLGAGPALSLGWPDGNVASPGAFVAGAEPAFVGGILVLGVDSLAGDCAAGGA